MQGQLPRLCLLIAYALLLAASTVVSSSSSDKGRFMQELRSKGDRREGERRQAKSNTRIVLVLGTGCPASFNAPEIERQCSKYYSQYARFQPWLVPEAPCHQLPAIMPDREDREYRLGWHLNCDYRMAYTAVMRRAAPLLKAAGWHFEVVDYMSEDEKLKVPLADVIIAPQNEFQDDLRQRYADKKFIVVHTDDQATISPDLDLDSDQIVGLFMHTSFTDLEENNKESPEFMRHCAWMIPEERLKNMDVWIREPPISKEALNRKVHTVIPQILRWVYPLDCGGQPEFVVMANSGFGQNRGFAPPLSERHVDIAFMGAVGEAHEIQQRHGEQLSMEDPDAVWIESLRYRTGVVDHRQSAINQMQELADKYNLTIVTEKKKKRFTSFVELLQNTKVFVSPFGVGEFSGKDYEAMLAGAIVVKPLASKIESFPNIYESPYVVETKGDFSDLEEKVMPLLLDPEKLRTKGQRIVERAQQHLWRYGDLERFSHKLDYVFEKLLLSEHLHSAASAEA